MKRGQTMALFMVICVSGCGTMIGPPVSIGENTFSVTARGDSPLSNVPGFAVKSAAIRMARHHCTSMGKDYEEIAITELPGFRPAAEVQFKCRGRTE